MTIEDAVIQWLKDDGQLAAHAREEVQGDEFEWGDAEMHGLLCGVYSSEQYAADLGVDMGVRSEFRKHNGFGRLLDMRLIPVREFLMGGQE